MPGVHPLLPVAVCRAEINRNGGIVVHEDGPGDVVEEPGVTEEHLGWLDEPTRPLASRLSSWASPLNVQIVRNDAIQKKAAETLYELDGKILTQDDGVCGDVDVICPFLDVEAISMFGLFSDVIGESALVRRWALWCCTNAGEESVQCPLAARALTGDRSLGGDKLCHCEAVENDVKSLDRRRGFLHGSTEHSAAVF